MQLLLEHIERRRSHSLLHFGLRCLGFGQGSFVHFLVRVERYSVYLHRHGRHHVGRFAVGDEGIKFVDVNLLVANDVRSDELTAIRVIKGLYGSIVDAGELADDGFDLFELDTETTDLHLSVPSADKLDISVLAVVNDVAGFVATQAVPIDEDFCGLLGLVEVSERHLRSGYVQFAVRTGRYFFAVLPHDDESRTVRIGFADRYIGFVLGHEETADIDGTLRRTIAVHQLIRRRIETDKFLAARTEPLQARDVRIIEHKLRRHLRRHEAVGNVLDLDILVEPLQVKTDLVTHNTDGRTGLDAAPEVHLERIKTVTGVGGVLALRSQAYCLNMKIQECQDVRFAEHDALGDTGCTGGIEQHKSFIAVVLGGIFPHVVQSLFGIRAIERHSRQTCLGDSERYEYHLFVTGHDERCHFVAATGDVLRIEGVRQTVCLGEGDPFVTCYAEDVIRPLSYVFFEVFD